MELSTNTHTSGGATPIVSAMPLQSTFFADGVPSMIWSSDLDGERYYFNRAWLEFTGARLEQVGGEGWLKHVHPEDRDKCKAVISRAVSERGSFQLEYRLKASDGRYRFVWDQGGPRLDVFGNVIGFSGSCTDVSELFKTQLLLRQQIEALNISNIVAITNSNGVIQFVNDEFCKISEYSRDELIGKDHRIIKSGTHPKAFIENLWSTIKGGKVWRGRICNRKKSGEFYWVDTVILPFKDEQGVITKFVSIRKDITAEMRSLEWLKSSNERWRSLMHNAPVGIFETRADGECIFVNELWLRWTGLRAESALGRGWIQAIHPDDRERVLNEWEKAIRHNHEFTMEYRFLRPDGTITWLLGRSFAIRNENNEVTGYLGSAQDITHMKNIQIELERAREEAILSSRLKSQFLANVSHEIRTPMNGILGMARLLGETKLNSEQRGFLDDIRHSAEALLGLINDILDLSKIESGRVVLEECDFSVEDVVNEAIAVVAPMVGIKKIDLRRKFSEAIVEGYRGDAGRIRQILVNLVGNATKFTCEGHIEVRVETLQSDHDSEVIRFEVEDTGVGIADSMQKRIFDEFIQGDAGATRKHGGTGLGLSICRRLVSLMQGEIGVRSVVGKGSVFWFSLPLRKLASGMAMARKLVPERKIGVTQPHPAHVLVAEDNPIGQRVVAQMLKKIGHSVDVVANGFEVLRAVERIRYDIVLMDCQMPEMDGFAATKLIREGWPADRHRIPIIAMTANAMKGDRELCLEAGMDDYLAKPLRLEDLAVKVDTWMSHQKGDGMGINENNAGPVVFEKIVELEEAGDATLIVDLIRLFLDGTPKRLKELKSEFEKSDPKSVSYIAHSMKSSCATLGALHMAELCQTIEETARNGSLANLAGVITSLESEYASVVPVLVQESAKRA